MSQEIDSAQARVGSTSKRLVLLSLLGIGLLIVVLASISTSLPDNEIRVISFEPIGKAELKTNITVKFSKEMVTKDSLDRPVLDPPLLFTPAIRGLARWVETDVLRFFPDEELLPATEYTVKVESGKTWASGFKIVNQEQYHFQTPGLRVTPTATFLTPERDLPSTVRVAINLQFNYGVSAQDLQNSISITGDKDAAKSQLEFQVRPSGEGGLRRASKRPVQPERESANASEFVVLTEPLEQLAAVQRYTLTIAKGLACMNCGAPLKEPFSFPIFVEARQPLVVQEVRSEGAGEEGVIYLRVSGSVPTEEAKSFVSVDPNVDFVLETQYGSLVLHGNFRPGQTYTVNVAKGMPSTSGSVLENDFSTRITIENLRPSVSFTSRAVFLPREGNGLLEFKTVNLNKVEVEVEQVFVNNLVYFLIFGYGGDYYYESRANLLGRSLFIKDMEVEGKLNEPLLSTIDVKRFVSDSARGIFRVAVRGKEERWVGDSRYAMITDIGISARLSGDYLMVWANSLSKSEPLAKATVTLISRNNQTLVEGKTDARGVAIFENIKDKLSGFEPFVITVARDGDLAYLRLDETLLPIADFDVAGRPYLASGYEAFIYTDRGVYRPGDTAHIVSVVRGVEAVLPPNFPYFLTVYDNQGRKFQSYRMATEGSAVVALDFPVPDYAATGKYAVAALIGEDLQIGRAEFQVEDFMPDRIKVALTTPTPVYRAGQTITADVDAKFLFGPPAARHRVSGHLTIEAQVFSPKGWSEYNFGNLDRSFAKMEVDLGDTLLNDTGGHTYRYEIPAKLTPPSALKGLLSATVSEQGGRGVSAYSEVVIHAYERYVGLKLALAGYAKPGEPVEASLIAVDADGKSVALEGCDVRFNRLVYNTVLKKDKTGIYRYMSERKEQSLDSTVVAVATGGGRVSFVPRDYGSYEIVARDTVGGHSSSVTFYASGWGYAPWAMTNPDKIELELDRKAYQSGEKAILQVRAPFGGRLLVTVEKTKVIDVISRDMPDNTAELEMPVRKEYFPNAYITATVVRSPESLEPSMPARAFGIVPLRLSVEDKRLELTIAAPEVLKPKSRATVSVQVNRPRASDVTIAAVDAGILQLTDFKTPDPMEFFYGKKQPRLNPYDLYSFIYPKVEQAQSHLAPGDKMFAAGRLRHINPISSRRVKSVALWSGIVKTDSTGKATLSFDLPEFSGKLVIMAVAAQNDRFGAASKEMTVRDKIVVQESFPRFVSPNDVFDGLVTLFNNTGARADITVSLAFDGPVELLSPATITVPLDNNREGAAVFKIKARPAPGKVSFTVTAKAGDEQSTLGLELPNRPAQPLTTKYGSGVLNKDGRAEFVFPGDWLPTTDQYVLKTSSMPAVSFARNIQYLLSYPYGCVEQTTSRLFPMLYFNDLVKVADPALFGTKGPDYFVQEGIVRLASMRLPDKSFAFWLGGSESNNWSTIYASHFLSEAARAGYFVDKKLLDEIHEHLDDMARGKKVKDLTDVHRIYAAYVLAEAGLLSQKVITYLKSVDASALQSYSRYQLAGALALSGNMSEASRLVPMDVQPDVFDPETGGDFNSGVRTNAILLETLLEVMPEHPSIPVLAKSLMEDSRVERWHTTQDNAFALMALGKYFKAKSNFGYTGSIVIEGDKSYSIDSTGFKLTRKDLANKKVKLAVTSGDGTCFYYWQASGIPLSNVQPIFDRGLRVRRDYLDEDGRAVDLTKVALGSRVVGVIYAEALDQPLYNVVINDLLPAGFEIENPRLKTTARLSWIPQQGARIDYQDIRDDRLLIFANLYPRQQVKFYYSLRAICAGEFKVPPVAGECMYNPLIASSGSPGAVTIAR